MVKTNRSVCIAALTLEAPSELSIKCREIEIAPRWAGRLEALVAGFGQENFKLDTTYPHLGGPAGQIRTGLSYKLGSSYEFLK